MTPLRAAVVGCRGMSHYHASAIAALPEYTLVAGCDLDEQLARSFAETYAGSRPYTDFDTMMTEEKPDVVVIATTTAAHAPLTLRAAAAGVRGIFCEKPMAIPLGDAIAMVETCAANGVVLAVNHQRRMLPVFRTMRRLMEDGSIGSVEVIRAGCAGDILTDGTHLIDTVRFLAGDSPVRSVFGQVYRNIPAGELPGSRGTLAAGGMRYGHAVETGSMAVIEFESGLRAELFMGKMQQADRRYQDYEILGTDGRLWRAGDQADPQLLIANASSGGWQAAPLDEADSDREYPVAGTYSYHLFAQTIEHGTDHPLSGQSGLRDHEIVTAIYESSRLRDRIEFPFEQPRYPLDIMIERGEM